jgi:hypothetical protein
VVGRRIDSWRKVEIRLELGGTMQLAGMPETMSGTRPRFGQRLGGKAGAHHLCAAGAQPLEDGDCWRSAANELRLKAEASRQRSEAS